VLKNAVLSYLKMCSNLYSSGYTELLDYLAASMDGREKVELGLYSQTPCIASAYIEAYIG